MFGPYFENFYFDYEVMCLNVFFFFFAFFLLLLFL